MKEYTFLARLAKDGTVVPEYPSIPKRICREWLSPLSASALLGLSPDEMADRATGTRLLVTLRKYTQKRSDRQNRYMWGVVVPSVRSFIKETEGVAWSRQAVYDYLNQVVVGNRVREEVILGRTILVSEGKRFSEMTTEEFAQAVDKIVQHFGELDWEIPLPQGDNLTENFLKDHYKD